MVFAGHLGAAEIPWPEEYIVKSESESPNGRYGVAIPGREMAEEDEDKCINYLADLKSHRLLGVITAAHYFSSKNHSGLHLTWTPDSSCCAVVYERHFGFDTITILEIDDAKFRQIDVGTHVQKALDAHVTKRSNDPKLEVHAVAHCRMSPGRKFRIRALATTNPREFHDQKTYKALFEGTFDLKTKKWTVSDTRPIDAVEEGWESLVGVYDDVTGTLERTTFENDDQKLRWLDAELNRTYQALRILLKPERFAQVKAEQIAWLKKRDGVSSTVGKCKLLEARIKALQELVW